VVERAPIRPFYAGWDTYNERIVEVVRGLSDEQLQVRPAPERWPIWATVGHTAGVRVYWLCGVLGEPGAETTPFPEPLTGVGWEDDLGTPRGADELVLALETTWRIVEGCLDRWTPGMLDDTFVAQSPAGPRVHTRQSVLMRLLSHDAYHCGELSQTLGIHGLPQIDLWGPASASPAGDAS
jgi:uncharacterized damage-inducible protein DinB